MKKELTPRERVLAAIHGEPIDQVPFTVYSVLFPRAHNERLLRDRGLALVERLPAVRIEAPNVRILREEYVEAGIAYMRETWRTPVGDVYATKRAETNYGTLHGYWTVDFPIKRLEDYRVIEYILRDSTYEPNYEAILRMTERIGQDGVVMAAMSSLFTLPGMSSHPMHHLMHNLLGVERFALELSDYPDEVLCLVDLIWQKQREVYPLMAEAPADYLIYGGNVHADLVGKERFRKYYMPCWAELAKYTKQTGKLVCCHFDANLSGIKELVGEAQIDIVEAFTPEPMCDMTVAEARALWPNKVLWVNFTSNVHLEPRAAVQSEARRIIRDAAPLQRFLLGVTEDVPESCMWDSMDAIADVIAEREYIN